MCEADDKQTPMFAQYRSIKKKYPDALLFFRMGDFYEMFFEDAVTASRELQITLTTRGKGTANAAPMCGVPKHTVQSYVSQLIDRGFSIAICEQVEDPKTAKGLVRREVTNIITPGTILDGDSLGAKRHNFLGAVFCGMHETCAFAWADVSTGQWTGIQFRRQADLWQWVRKIAPAELLVMDGKQPPADFNQEGIRLVRQPALNFDLKRATHKLLEAQGVQELGALGLETKPDLARACGAILAYLEQTQMGAPARLLAFVPLDPGKRMLIDEFTERNLEIFTRLNGRKGKGTLRHLVDDTVTPMGGRLLEDMLRHPFRDMRQIRRIQEVVGWFCVKSDIRQAVRSALGGISDLERLTMRVSLGRCTPRDMLGLRNGLAAIPGAVAPLLAAGLSSLPPLMASALGSLDELADIAALLDSAIADDAPATSTEGGIFRQGYNAELDAQLDLLENGERKFDELVEKERERTGVSKLKRGYNRVFGYYYEVPKNSLKDGAPEHFIRRQSLANAERFSSVELKELEESIMLASERRKQLESEMFQNLREHITAQKDRIFQTADVLGHLDYWQTLAEVGTRENWSMPEMTDDTEITIRGGRHPVVESIIGASNFVPNDFVMDSQKRLCLLTGPNMAGKSTILRQVAIICILAQIGGMVPADHARLGIVDRLFSRVGASDDLAQGQSTFMVEMMETARILRQATRRSLIILDEIGRGTSTYDGMAIAWAVVEDLASRCQRQLRTIFATHYHELTALESAIPGLFTMNIAVGAYDNREIIFLHRLVPGPSDKSYGIEVARLAGIPYPVVQRARDILKRLENAREPASVRLQLPGIGNQTRRAVQAAILQELGQIDPESMDAEDCRRQLLLWRAKLDGLNG